MGYDIARFIGEVAEELICPICSGVLEEPLYASECEHAYCEQCINEWLLRQFSCPIDSQPITPDKLKTFPRILENFLSSLHLVCDNADFGCTTIVKLNKLEEHQGACKHDPKKPAPIEQNCRLAFHKDEVSHHNCIRKLGNHHTLEDSEALEQDKLIRWVNALQKISVADWCGLISAPDLMTESKIRRALILSGCPPRLTAELVKNAHSKRWPLGLKTFETRKANKEFCTDYVFRKIPGIQAIIVMAIDNQHMNNNMLLEPGFLMIFSCGIEN